MAYPVRDPKRRPTHPGAVLREIVIPEVIREHNLTKTAIAEGLGLSRNQFYSILREAQPVTARRKNRSACGWARSGALVHVG